MDFCMQGQGSAGYRAGKEQASGGRREQLGFSPELDVLV